MGLGDGVPEGCQMHLVGVGDDGQVRIVEVWESREKAEAFTEQVRHVREELGIAAGRPDIEYLDVHRIAETQHARA